ncbi:MAG: hypothetical protein AAGH87_11130, partial [Pseudomonadota bacterium]
LLALGALSLTACDANDGPVEEFAEDVDNVVEPRIESAEDQLENAADEMEETADAVEDAVDTPQQ